MHTKITPLFLRTLSSLHTGSGDDNGLVDLPIQRELVTGYPKIEASTLKGSIRSRVEQLGADPVIIHLAFGYDSQSEYKSEYDDSGEKKNLFSGQGNEKEYAQQFMGALAFTDARLLFFPIRSAKGVFALVTCPYVLHRFAEDLELAGSTIGLRSVLDTAEMGDLKSTNDHSGFCLTLDAGLQNNNQKIILEEYVFEVKTDRNSQITALIHQLKKIVPIDRQNLVILDDDVFSDFTQLFTERMTRNKIDDKTGTVTDGGLFTEEYLPPEAILYSLVMADKPRQPETKTDEQGRDVQKKKDLPGAFNSASHVIQFIKDGCWNGQSRRILQIGGNTTVGKGIVELLFNAAQP